MKRFFIFSFLFLSAPCFCAQKNIVGSVVFTWDRAGDITLVAKYKEEEIHPLAGMHMNNGGYTTKEAKKQRFKAINVGKLVAGRCYRTSNVRFSFWEYCKSFLWTPRTAERQTLIVFDDGSRKYIGPQGKVADPFVVAAQALLREFGELQKLQVV